MVLNPAAILLSWLLVTTLFAGPAMAQPTDSGADFGEAEGADTPSYDGGKAKAGKGSGRGKAARKAFVEPYIEAEQIVTTRNLPLDETFTYTRVAAGVDGSLVGQNNGVSLSLRYERRIDWGDNGQDGDVLSGIANGYTTVAQGLQLHAGALATRGSIDRSGGALPGAIIDQDDVTKVYSVYAGPSLVTQLDDVVVNANYRMGYSKVDQGNARIVTPGQPLQDIFDESTVHAADVSAAIAPGDLLPVGLGVNGSYSREDISNLDQRIENGQVSAVVTVPVSYTVQVSGAVGYETVEISSRDALFDSNGLPVVGPGGRYVTDKSAPRVIAYDVDGLIWDAGVMWRPSTRTSLTAHVGRRYGSTSYTGTFSYAPTPRSSVNVAVYDNLAGFGGQLNRALDQMPTDFTAIRNPLTGDISGCVNSLEGGSCLSGVLGSMRSAAFRARGVMANYAMQMGRISTGIGGGYDRRRFIAAPGTVLAVANGLVDENYWLAAYVNARLDERSMVQTNLYANWIDSAGVFGGNSKSWGATAAYYRNLDRHLTARAALGIEGMDQTAVPEDFWSASALVGVRYSF